MAEWVICFDPWLGLKTPAPALYPEWGERFFHCPGPLTDARREDIGLALETLPGPPACWLLAPAGQGGEALAQAGAEILAALPGLPALEPVLWRTPPAPGLAAADAPAGLSIDLVFDGNLDAQSAQRAQTLLLPLALRFLLGRGQWLEGRGAGPLSRLELRSGAAAARPALEALRARLDEAACHARHRLATLGEAEFKAALYDTQPPPYGELLRIPPPPPFAPGPWYRPLLDEQAAAGWVDAAAAAVLRESGEYSARLAAWTRETLREWHRLQPGRRALGQSPQALRAELAGQLAAVPDAACEDLGRRALPFRQAQMQALARALRRRPRRGLFLGFALGGLALAAGFCGLGAAGGGPYPSPWQALPAGLWLAACAACAGLAQQPLRRAAKAARAGLHELARAAETAADGEKNAANARIRNLLLRRNLDLVDAEIERRQAERGQWEYHLARMRAVADALGLGRLSEGRQASAGLPFDPARPEAANPAYFWQGGANPELRLGQDRRVLDDPAGRFGGVEAIIVNGGRG